MTFADNKGSTQNASLFSIHAFEANLNEIKFTCIWPRVFPKNEPPVTIFTAGTIAAANDQ